MPAVRDCVAGWTDGDCKAANQLHAVFDLMASSPEELDEQHTIALYEAIQATLGEEADIDIQKDASEFLGDLLRALRTVPESDNFALQHFKGEFTNQLRAPEGLSMDINERFFILAMEVRGVANLEDSLTAFLKTETVPFRWRIPPDNKLSLTTTETEKCVVLRHLPTFLIFQLNRFSYDRARQRKIKLHGRFAFPGVLDMRPFCSTGGMYQLSGVIAHRGRSAYRGHYYSYVRSRGNDKDMGEEWYLMDDEYVLPFDKQLMEEECFGEDGEDEIEVRDYDPEEDDGDESEDEDDEDDEDAPRSAMLLFYHRIAPDEP